MKKLLLCLGLCLSMTTFAQKKEWLDPELNAINRAPARADYFAYPSREMAELCCCAAASARQPVP